MFKIIIRFMGNQLADENYKRKSQALNAIKEYAKDDSLVILTAELSNLKTKRIENQWNSADEVKKLLLEGYKGIDV